NPPILHVGLISVANVDRAPAADHAGVSMVEPLGTVQVVEIPEDRCVFAVDLKRVKGLVAAGITGGLERGERAVAESGEESRGVIDSDFGNLAGLGVLALLDESLGHGGDLVDRTIQPEGGIDTVGQQVPGDAAARDV